MKSFTYTISDPIGIHARPAGLLAKEAKKYASTVTIDYEAKEVKVTQMLKLMGMGIKQGSKINVIVDGPDEEACAAAMETFFKANL